MQTATEASLVRKDIDMDVDTDGWYKNSRSYKSHVEADMGIAQRLYNSVRLAYAKVPKTADVDALPVVDFLDLTVAPLPVIPDIYNNRKFAFIGEWYSEKKDWKFCLAIPLPLEDPFRPCLEPITKLFVTYIFPSNMLDDVSVEVASIEVSLVEPDTVRTVKGFTPETMGFCSISNQFFSGKDKLIVFELKGHYDFLSALRRFSFRGHQKFLIWIETQYTIHVERLPDLSPYFKDVLHVDLILDQIVATLSLQDIASLRATSPSLRDKLSGLPKRRLRSLFAKYFSTPSHFAASLRTTGAVVGGSGILSVLCPGNWEPGDLDIVVANYAREGLVVFLESEGFVVELSRDPQLWDVYASDDRIKFTYERFLKRMPNRTEEMSTEPLRIDLCVLYPGPYDLTPGNFILTYHSTPVMNLYNGHAIFCLFPSLTFNQLFTRNRFTPTERMETGIAKYVARGYEEVAPGTYIQDSIPGNVEQLSIEMLPPIWYQKIDL